MAVSTGGALWGMKCLVPDPNSREMTVSPIPGTGIDVPVPWDFYFGAGIHYVYEYMEADGIQVAARAHLGALTVSLLRVVPPGLVTRTRVSRAARQGAARSG